MAELEEIQEFFSKPINESKGAALYFEDLKYYYQKSLRYLDADEREEYKTLAKNFFSKLLNEDNGDELLNKAKVDALQRLQRGEIDTLPEDPKAEYIKRMLSKEKIQEISETIKLGEGVIEEELCAKGKAYRKRRMAAGEKSSAYLSGRAVKVCKGQMKGEGLDEDELNEGEFCPQCLAEVIEGLHEDHQVTEAKYKGKTVTLNKPMRGDIKKFKVYVNSGKKNADGSIKVKKVNFGHGGTTAKKLGQKTMKIRKSNPKARAAFRARHRCDKPGPKTMARYCSCKKW